MDLDLLPESVAMAAVTSDLVDGWLSRPPTPEQRWSSVTEVGLDGALAPEEGGGLGLDLTDLLPVLRALGPAAAHWPWAATLVAGPAGMHALDREVGAGGSPVGVAVLTGSGKARARHVESLGHVVLLSATQACATDASDWQAVEHADLVNDMPWSQAPDEAATRMRDLPAAGDVLAAGRVAEAALLLGVSDHALHLGVQHAKTRQQFGKAIGSFQAVKHLLAEARTSLAFADPLVLGAAIALTTPAPTRHRDAAVALVAAVRAAEHAVRTSMQVHAAIGYTCELPLGQLLAAVAHGVQAWGGLPRLTDDIDASLVTGSLHIGDGVEPSHGPRSGADTPLEEQ